MCKGFLRNVGDTVAVHLLLLLLSLIFTAISVVTMVTTLFLLLAQIERFRQALVATEPLAGEDF